jgi:glyoxylase-like metal-dependent hydrolase (beta-lactamase superfamily II)
MRAIDVRHQGREKVICCWEVDGVLIDPGPGVTEETLLNALGGERPRALLLTHIHFDHAGVAGALVKRWPDLPVYVHERGAPHLVDPSKLMASAGRLYGGDEGLRTLWGEMVPLPEANLRVLKGGETGVEGAFRVEYTPGHASHHVCYFHEPSRWAFVGDVGGARIPPHEFTVAPTPPPDIDVAAWKRSVELVRSWDPVALGLTHFGEAPPEQLDRVLQALDAQVELEGSTGGEDGFVAAMDERIHAAMDAEDAESMIAATPLDQLHMGLARWRKKFA